MQYLDLDSAFCLMLLKTFSINCGEIEFENLFIDGTKIEANVNRYILSGRKRNKNSFAPYKTDCLGLIF